MRFLARSTREPHGAASTPPVGGWASLPKNPVFYPPTLRNSSAPPAMLTSTGTAATAVAGDRGPGRLMARLKAVLMPRAAAPDPASRALDLHGPPPDVSEWNRPALTSARPPRLVARSPLREASISSDLCMLAELGFLPRNARTVQPVRSPDTLYCLPDTLYCSPIETPARAGRCRPNRAGLAASVVLPPRAPPTHLCGREMPLSGGPAPHLGLGQRRRGLARSTSLMTTPDHLLLQVPSPPPMPPPPPPPLPLSPLRSQKASVGSYRRSHRGSGSSGSTAAPSLAPPASSSASSPAGSPTDNERSSILSDCTRAPRMSFSPSRKSLAAASAAVCACCCGPADHLCPELLLLLQHALPAANQDVFDDYVAAARRPYSEGFSKHAHIAAGGAAHGAGLCVGPAAFSDAQRAVYMRSSCADSELVKSTFDLAKLLPSAPQ